MIGDIMQVRSERGYSTKITEDERETPTYKELEEDFYSRWKAKNRGNSDS
jgi:hypothetical protein